MVRAFSNEVGHRGGDFSQIGIVEINKKKEQQHRIALDKYERLVVHFWILDKYLIQL